MFIRKKRSTLYSKNRKINGFMESLGNAVREEFEKMDSNKDSYKNKNPYIDIAEAYRKYSK